MGSEALPVCSAIRVDPLGGIDKTNCGHGVWAWVRRVALPREDACPKSEEGPKAGSARIRMRSTICASFERRVKIIVLQMMTCSAASPSSHRSLQFTAW